MRKLPVYSDLWIDYFSETTVQSAASFFVNSRRFFRYKKRKQQTIALLSPTKLSMGREKVAYGFLLPCHRVGPHLHSPGDSMSNDFWSSIRYLNSNGSLYFEFMFGIQMSVFS